MDTQSFWDFEFILFTHNSVRKPIPSHFTESEANYIKDCVEVRLKKILNSENYKDEEFCKLLNLVVKITVHYALILNYNLEQSIKDYISTLKALYEKNRETYPQISYVLLLAFYVLQGLFLKENWLGKSYLYHDADYKLKKDAEVKLKELGMDDRLKKKIIDSVDYNKLFEERIGTQKLGSDLNMYSYDFIKSPQFVEYRSPKIQEYLSVDGEEIFRKLSYMGLFVLIKEYLKSMDEILSLNLPSITLWKARVNFLHNKILNEKLTSLQLDVIKQYNIFFEQTNKALEAETEIRAALKLEFGNVLLYYYKYGKSLKAFQEAQEIRRLNIKFTGRLGYKTKYQTFETAQLVVEAEPRDMSEPSGDKKAQEEQGEDGPINVALEEDTILLEKPRLVDLNMDNLNKDFTVFDQMIVLSLIHHLQRTTPTDDLLQEQVGAYLRSIMDKSQNWLVFSMCLYVRSLNEFQRTKTKERSMLQLQSLLDQFNERKPETYERIKYYYSLYYPSFLELQRIMAEKYMEMGMVMSSSNLFERLEMLEESVECLFMAGHPEKAKEKALEMIEKKPTAKIICIYGELTGDATYFQKAWEFSDKKFARAKRSEAKYYFNRNDLPKAISCFKEALEVNTYHSATWYTLGCAYLKTNQLHDAAVAFGQVVSIDETQGEAWANMASALSLQGKKNEAFSALQQAVKHNENSWRIWQNLMFTALETMKFKTFLEAIERLLKMEQKQCIETPVLKKMNQVFVYQIQKCGYEQTVDLTFYRKRITGLYKLMEDKLATQPYFWAQYQEFIDLHRDFNDKAKELETTLDNNSEVQPNYREHLKKRLEQDRMTDKEIDEKIADLCMKECHSIMIVGWEVDKRLCKMLQEAVEKMQIAFMKVNDEKQLVQLKIFLDANTPKIRKTLSE